MHAFILIFPVFLYSRKPIDYYILRLVTAEEVVSIYGPNLITPESRTPYYIKIRRCIINEDVFFTSNPQCWSVPKENSRQEIEIVVPDINDNSMFYKYVVYNDTACKCMTRNNGAFDIAQHKHLESHEGNVRL